MKQEMDNIYLQHISKLRGENAKLTKRAEELWGVIKNMQERNASLAESGAYAEADASVMRELVEKLRKEVPAKENPYLTPEQKEALSNLPCAGTASSSSEEQKPRIKSNIYPFGIGQRVRSVFPGESHKGIIGTIWGIRDEYLYIVHWDHMASPKAVGYINSCHLEPVETLEEEVTRLRKEVISLQGRNDNQTRWLADAGGELECDLDQIGSVIRKVKELLKVRDGGGERKENCLNQK